MDMSDPLERLTSALAARYRIEQELGAGGMATVYLAEDLKLERRVAIKVLRPELAAAIGAERFLREVKLTARLEHPHILTLHDSGEADGFLFYVMPYVEGESLRDRLNREKQLPIEDAIQVTREVADALDFAHQHDVVHRDIKPENILLGAGHARVADFGIARAIGAAGGDRLTETGLAVGTPEYMSPEQAAGESDFDARSDVYALGCVLYEMLAGEPPFTGSTVESVVRQHLSVDPHPITSRRASVPTDVAEAMARSLAKAPADRFARASDFANALTTGETAAPRWQHPLAVAGLFGVVAIALLGLVYLLMIQLGLPDWVFSSAAVLLVVALPIAVATSLVERQRTHASGKPSTPARGVHRWLTWRRAVAGSALAFVGLGVVTVAYATMRSLGIGPVGTLLTTGALEERDRVLVLEFVNRTPDSTLAATLTEALRIDLSQSPVVSVLEPQELLDALRRMGRDPAEAVDLELAREITEREGVKAIVAGEIGTVGGAFVLSARVLAAATGAGLIAERETAGNAQDLINAVDRLSAKLRERIGESLRTVRSTPPLHRVTTSSLEALRLFSQGVLVMGSGTQTDAIRFFEQAIALDSGFAMAYRKLATIHLNTRRAPVASIVATRKAHEHRDRLTDRERYLTLELYYLLVEDDREQSTATLRRMLERYPDDLTGLNSLGVNLEWERRWKDAEELYRRARSIADARGVKSFSYSNILVPQFALNKAPELDSSLNLLERVRPDVALFNRALIATAHRDLAMAQEGFEQYSQQYPTRLGLSRWVLPLPHIAAVRGQLGRATQEWRRLMTIAEEHEDPSAVVQAAAELAVVTARYRGVPGEATRVLNAALERHPLDSLAADARPYPALVSAYAALGEAAVAAELLTAYRQEVPREARRLQPTRHHAMGSMALASAEFQEAIEAFRAWYDDGRCASCGLYELAHTFDRVGNLDSSIVMYERAVGTRDLRKIYQDFWWLPVAYRRLGELYEDRGNHNKAADYYNRFIDLWKDADPELQPQVEEVKQRLTRLVGEPR
jgi:tetratricopeptide (TPR) repeat protein/tRNA A-37 threonylcarbamoyl transferase component Bud32